MRNDFAKSVQSRKKSMGSFEWLKLFRQNQINYINCIIVVKDRHFRNESVILFESMIAPFIEKRRQQGASFCL